MYLLGKLGAEFFGFDDFAGCYGVYWSTLTSPKFD